MRWGSLLFYKRVIFVCLIAILISSGLASVANAKYSDETITIKAFEPQAWVDLRDGGSEYHDIDFPWPYPGHDVAIKFHINNSGNIPSGPFVVHVYASLDGTFDPAGDFFIAETKIDTILPQDYVKFYGSKAAHGIIPYGMQDLDDDLVYNLYWIIDPLDQVEEKNEDNNLIECGSGQQIEVRHRDPLNDVFDLVDAGEEFRSFENAADGTQIAQNGDTINVSCKIRNAGNLPSGSYNVTFYAHNDCYIHGGEDEVVLGSKEMTSDGICNFSFEIETDPNEPGYNLDAGYKYYIGWIIDAEQGEGRANNEATKMGYTLFVTVSEDMYGNDSVVDLVDEGYQCYSSPGDNKLRTFVPQEVYAGESIVVHTIIRNRGNADIGNSFVVNFYASTDIIIEHNDHLLGTAEIQSLAGGESVTAIIEGNTSSLAPGNYYVGWIIDSRYENGNWVSDVAESTYYDYYHDPDNPTLVIGEKNNISIIFTFPTTKLTILTDFCSIFLGLNERQHYTEDYPPEYKVLRRGQSFYLGAHIVRFDDDYQKICINITKPNGDTEVLVARKEAGRFGPGWDCTYERRIGDIYFFKIHIPGNEQVGKYQLNVMIQQSGVRDITCDVPTPEFYVIFNPWSSEDDDVFYPQEHELDFFATGKKGRQYYPPSFHVTSWWELEPANKTVFETAIETVSGNISAFISANETMDKISYNAGHDGLKRWVPYQFDKSDGAYDYYKLGNDDPFDPDEILAGVWSNPTGFTSSPNVVYERNIPEIIAIWKANRGNNPYGQCMQFAGLGTALLRSVGIPSRMVSIPGGKKAHNPSEDWGGTFHIWSEAWINNEWKEVATTYQDPNGPSSKCNALYQTEIRSNTGGFVDYVYTDKVKRLFFLWRLSKADILGEYKACIKSAPTSQLALGSLDQVKINVTTDKTQYALGEEVILNISVRNDGNISINDMLTTDIIEYHGDGIVSYVWNDIQPISVPPHTTYNKTYTLSKNDYKFNGQFYVDSNIDNIRNAAQFNVTGGLKNLTVILPETVLINESFDVRLIVENIADTTIDNIEINADFGSDATVTGAPMNFTIPTLAPGTTNTTTWVVSIPDDGYQCMEFSAQSERGDYERISTGTEVMSNPFLRVNVEVPSSVQKDTTFTVSATIVNEGDLAAEAVQSVLNLPPELTTSDDLIQYIGTIDPHANATIVWNLVANEAGISAFSVVTNSSTDSCEVVIFIPVFIYDHVIALSVEQ